MNDSSVSGASFTSVSGVLFNHGDSRVEVSETSDSDIGDSGENLEDSYRAYNGDDDSEDENSIEANNGDSSFSNNLEDSPGTNNGDFSNNLEDSTRAYNGDDDSEDEVGISCFFTPRGGGQPEMELGSNPRSRPPLPAPESHHPRSTYHEQMLYRYAAEISGSRTPHPLLPVEPVPLRSNEQLYIGELAAKNATMALCNEEGWQNQFGQGSRPSKYLDPEVDVMPHEQGYGGHEIHPSTQAKMAKSVSDVNYGRVTAVLSGQAAKKWKSLLPCNFQLLADHDAGVRDHNETARQKNILEEFTRIPRSEMKIVEVADGQPVILPVVPPSKCWPEDQPTGDTPGDPICLG